MELEYIYWVVPPPCNSRKGFTFWFNRGLLLTSFWDCYRVGAVPNIYIYRLLKNMSMHVAISVQAFPEFSVFPINHPTSLYSYLWLQRLHWHQANLSSSSKARSVGITPSCGPLKWLTLGAQISQLKISKGGFFHWRNWQLIPMISKGKIKPKLGKYNITIYIIASGVGKTRHVFDAVDAVFCCENHKKSNLLGVKQTQQGLAWNPMESTMYYLVHSYAQTYLY